MDAASGPWHHASLFAMLVIMALVTTFATTPVLHLLTRVRPLEGPEPSPARGD